MYLQVSESDLTKMSVSNLAKILGPTIVGFSTPDPNSDDMIREVEVQATTLERLIEIDGDYWNSFIDIEEDEYENHEIYQSPNIPTPSGTRGLSSIIPRRATCQQQLQTTSSKIFSSPVLQ